MSLFCFYDGQICHSLPAPRPNPNLIVCTVPPTFRANPWRGAENTTPKYVTLALDCFESKAIKTQQTEEKLFASPLTA